MTPPTCRHARRSPASAGSPYSPSRRWGRGVADAGDAIDPAIRRVPPVAPVRDPPLARDPAHPRAGAWSRPLTIMSVSPGGGRSCWRSSSAGCSLAKRTGAASALQHALRSSRARHRQSELAVAELETPARIVAAAAAASCTLVRPANVVELPYVSLSVPVPTPKATPAPAPPTTVTTATTATSTTPATMVTPATTATDGTATTTATSTP